MCTVLLYCVLFVCKCVLYCCTVYCLCVNVYCAAATGCQPTAVNKYIYIYWYHRERQKYVHYSGAGPGNLYQIAPLCPTLPPGRYSFELRSYGSH